MSPAPNQQQLLEMLAQRMRRGESASSSVQRIRGTGIRALDELLVGGGLPAGCLMEWLGPASGAGVDTLALWAAVRARRPDELLLVVDSRGDFYPPAAIPLGLDIRTTVVIRGAGFQPAESRSPDSRSRDSGESRDLLWAVEQALRTTGVGVVVSWWDRLSPQSFRRLQLAAEKGGSLGVLLRPARVRGEPSFAEVRWGVQSLPSGESGVRRWRVELCRARRQLTGGSVELELHHDRDHNDQDHNDEDRLHLVPTVAAAARVDRQWGGEPAAGVPAN